MVANAKDTFVAKTDTLSPISPVCAPFSSPPPPPPPIYPRLPPISRRFPPFSPVVGGKLRNCVADFGPYYVCRDAVVSVWFTNTWTLHSWSTAQKKKATHSHFHPLPIVVGRAI